MHYSYSETREWVEHHRLLLELHPETYFLAIEGAGRWVQYEVAERFNPLLAEMVSTPVSS